MQDISVFLHLYFPKRLLQLCLEVIMLKYSWYCMFLGYVDFFRSKVDMPVLKWFTGDFAFLIFEFKQGPNFFNISRSIQPEHFVPLCSLLATVQRHMGIWRLQEVNHWVLTKYHFPCITYSLIIFSLWNCRFYAGIDGLNHWRQISYMVSGDISFIDYTVW